MIPEMSSVESMRAGLVLLDRYELVSLLSFIEAMEVSVASTGLPSLQIASASSFPEGDAAVVFEITGADIAEYVVSQSMTITTDVTAHRPESDTVVRASWTVVVGVTTQGAVSNLDR